MTSDQLKTCARQMTWHALFMPVESQQHASKQHSIPLMTHQPLSKSYDGANELTSCQQLIKWRTGELVGVESRLYEQLSSCECFSFFLLLLPPSRGLGVINLLRWQPCSRQEPNQWHPSHDMTNSEIPALLINQWRKQMARCLLPHDIIQVVAVCSMSVWTLGSSRKQAETETSSLDVDFPSFFFCLHTYRLQFSTVTLAVVYSLPPSLVSSQLYINTNVWHTCERDIWAAFNWWLVLTLCPDYQ